MYCAVEPLPYSDHSLYQLVICVGRSVSNFEAPVTRSPCSGDHVEKNEGFAREKILKAEKSSISNSVSGGESGSTWTVDAESKCAFS